MNPKKPIFYFIYSLAIFTLLNSCTMNKMLTAKNKPLLSSINLASESTLNESDLHHLPYPVQNWLKQSGMLWKSSVKSVWLTQQAKLKMRPDQENWYDATAEQVFTVANPGYVWEVKMNIK